MNEQNDEVSAGKILGINGVRLAAMPAHIRYANRLDLVLIELSQGSCVSGVFTQNQFCAAPVTVAKKHLAASAPRYLLINTGNANAGTGEAGIVDALRCCQAVADIAKVKLNEVLPFSTGVIGEELPVEKILLGVPTLFTQLTPNNFPDAATGILTTDTRPKLLSKTVELNGQTISVTGFAKGSGMIKPNMATMLAYVFTDLQISQTDLDRVSENAVTYSFNRITVDGDTSTNDCCITAATGQSGLSYDSFDDSQRHLFEQCVNELFCDLAMSLIKDAEGATKFITIKVVDGLHSAECLKAAYAIAESPLVKTAMFASDPNWGRILAALGRAGIDDLDIEGVTIHLGDACIVRGGTVDPLYTEDAGQAAMAGTDIDITVSLSRGNCGETVWTSDLSHDYVHINADYRS